MEKALLETCIKDLENGVKKRNAPFHTGVLTTYPADSRMVVIRSVCFEKRYIQNHTDIRSRKIDFIQKNNKGSFLFYDTEKKIQLRFRTHITVHHKDDVALLAWEKTKLFSRLCYLGAPSGAKLNSPEFTIPPQKQNLSFEESHIGFENFCVLRSHFDEMEYLHLKAGGHVRALFKWDNTNSSSVAEPSVEWLAP